MSVKEAMLLLLLLLLSGSVAKRTNLEIAPNFSYRSSVAATDLAIIWRKLPHFCFSMRIKSKIKRDSANENTTYFLFFCQTSCFSGHNSILTTFSRPCLLTMTCAKRRLRPSRNVTGPLVLPSRKWVVLYMSSSHTFEITRMSALVHWDNLPGHQVCPAFSSCSLEERCRQWETPEDQSILQALRWGEEASQGMYLGKQRMLPQISLTFTVCLN